MFVNTPKAEVPPDKGGRLVWHAHHQVRAEVPPDEGGRLVSDAHHQAVRLQTADSKRLYGGWGLWGLHNTYELFATLHRCPNFQVPNYFCNQKQNTN